jgi:Zn-dependent M28 family amino/carboxypeptidase
MAGSRHLMVKFDSSAYARGHRKKALVAHYDREKDTPGANDNSAACFQLLALAERLKPRRDPHGVLIFFTDNEEASGSKGASGQGSFALAEGFRRLKLDSTWFFTFDCTGVGDCLILSTSAIELFRNEKSKAMPIYGQTSEIHAWTRDFLLSVNSGDYLALATPYSDNLGLVLGGIPSVALSVLPFGEAVKFSSELAKHRVLTDVLLRKEYRTARNDAVLSSVLPPTWKIIHSASDSRATLTKNAFALMGSLLDALAEVRIPKES